MKYLFTVALLFTYALTFSQSNYHQGSLIDNNGQTHSGYINYREWDKAPKFIEFKNSPEDKKPQTFFPSTIKSFVIDDFEQYCTYNGKITLNKIEFPNLDTYRDTTTQQANIFLKVIISGSNLSLFSYTDSIKTRYFVQEKDQQPLELLYQQYNVDGQIHAIPSFIGQLSYLSNKYAETNTAILTRLEKAKYESYDIEWIVNQINGGIKENKSSKKSVSYIRYFAGAALNNSTTAIDGYYYIMKKSTTYTPEISAGIDIFNNPNVQKLIFRAELGFTYINPQIRGYPDYATYILNNEVETSSYNQYTISLTPQVIFNIYNKDAFKVYLDAGLRVNYSFYSSNLRRVSGAYESDEIPFHMEPLWLNFPLQAGVVLNKRIEFFVSYASPTAYTSYQNFSISSAIYTAGIHFLFKKPAK